MITANQKPEPVLLNEAAAAWLLSLSVASLRKDRLGARRIPFVRIGRSIRYSSARLAEFANEGVK